MKSALLLAVLSVLISGSWGFVAPCDSAATSWLGHSPATAAVAASSGLPTSTAGRVRDGGARGLVMRKGRKSPRKMLNDLKPGVKKSVDANATWLQVLNSESEVPAGDGGLKVVEGKYAGEKLVFMVVRWGGKVYAVSESCGRCKFPLIDAKVAAGEGGDAPVLTCPLCGQTYDVATGARGAVADVGGLKGAFGGLMAQKEPKDLRAYETRVTPEGGVVVRMG